MEDAYFMEKALEQAAIALSQNEFPVGCVIVCENRVIVTGAREGTAAGCTNEVDHAEIVALRRLETAAPALARRKMSIFCTMEPCLMCYAAILLSGLGRIVYAYEDVMGGGTGCDLASLPPLYESRRIPVVPRVMRQESLSLFKRYFSDPENAYWCGSLLAEYTLETT